MIDDIVTDDIVTAYSTQEKVYETDEKTWCSTKFQQTKLFKPYKPYICTKNSRMMATVSLFHVLVDMKGPSGNGQNRGSSNPQSVAISYR